MTTKFLKAKHWQLFLLILGVPLLLQCYAMSPIVFNMTGKGDPNFDITYTMLTLFPVIMILFTLLVFGWFWSIAIGLQKYIPKNIKMKVKKFKTLLLIPVAYMVLISLLIGFLGGGMFTDENVSVSLSGTFTIVFILGLHLLSMFCTFHSLYFVSKTIKTAELQREVTFGDFIGEFFLIWFFPIGIWIVQPKINSIVEMKSIA